MKVITCILSRGDSGYIWYEVVMIWKNWWRLWIMWSE